MKKMLFSILVSLQVGIWGGNVLLNGKLDAEQSNFPDHWVPVITAGAEYSYARSGGPDGGPAVILKGRGTLLVRQHQVFLVAGERYRLSGYFKTKNLKSSKAGIAVINRGWTDEQGIEALPENSEWQYHEKIFEATDSMDGTYGVVIQIRNGSGELQAADLKLEPLTDAGCRGRNILLDKLGLRELIPLGVLLRIPAARPQLIFEWAGKLDGSLEDYECIFQSGDDFEARSIFRGGRAAVDLSKLKLGSYTLKSKVVRKESGETAYERKDKIRIVERIDTGNGKELNNLVTELLSVSVDKAGELSFINPRDGWVYMKTGGAEFQFQGKAIKNEAFRCLKAGEYRIGVTALGHVAVRTVPEMINYPPCRDSYVNVSGNGVFDWTFMERYVLRALTTHNGGRLPGAALTESRGRGLQWLANLSKGNMATLDERLKQTLRLPEYDGVTLDEFFFGRSKELHEWSSILQSHRETEKLIYTWIVGKPSLAGLDGRFISTALNASGGCGKLLYEAYAHPQPDETAAAAYLKGMLNEAVRKYNEFFPEAVKGMGIILGNFVQMPIISLDYLPEVDYKYYLDMQLNIIANSPDFKGLGSTGFWGSYYADEEMYRWSFRLLRHYAVEGKKEMLSPEYGFKYNPGLLFNGDFTEGLKHWAYSGQVGTGGQMGYGALSQGRWLGGNDTFCIMTRGKEANALSQTAKGLVSGKLYTLHFAVADYNDVMNMKRNPRRLPLEVELEGAEIIPAKSYVYIDDRTKSGKDNNYARINLYRIVFRATAENCRIEFHDRAADAGEKQVLSFVALRPYYSE